MPPQVPSTHSAVASQHCALSVQGSPRLRQIVDGGAQTSSPPAFSAQSPSQHSASTVQDSSAERQARGAQNAEILSEFLSWPGSQNATSLGSSPGSGFVLIAVTQICWRLRVPACVFP